MSSPLCKDSIRLCVMSDICNLPSSTQLTPVIIHSWNFADADVLTVKLLNESELGYFANEMGIKDLVGL